MASAGIKEFQQQQQQFLELDVASPVRLGAFAEERRQLRLRRRATVSGALLQPAETWFDERWEQVYFHVAMHLDFDSLKAMDATGRHQRDANRAFGGRWWSLGAETFLGKEVYGDGSFLPVTESGGSTGRDAMVPSWKQRYAKFSANLKTFAAPFDSATINTIANDDEVAYFRCVLRTDHLIAEARAAAYMEVEVRANPDNFSLAVVDFDEGGASSLTFSPDTGAVISERKLCESPRKVQGMFVQPLESIAVDAKFLGRVGLLISGGRIAFFRKFRTERREENGDVVLEDGEWETTGFVTDLVWAEGQRLTPCIAFRSAGQYELEVSRVDSQPPFVPHVMGKDDGMEWSPLDWEAPAQENEEEEE